MTEEVDERLYPRLAAYVAALPNGLASYPDCKAKGTLISSAIENHDIRALGPGLPSELVGLLRHPPPSTAWVAAPMSDAIFYAMADAFYPADDAVMEWTRERTRRSTQSRMYRALSRVSRPSTLLRMTTSVHGLFQRGTEMIAQYADDTASVRLEHPPHLHGGLNHRSNVPMLEEVLRCVRATNIVVTMTESTPTYAIYVATWST